MEIIPMLLKEMAEEAKTTRNMLARVPDDQFDWQPHPKSMTIRRLATHVAEIPGWVAMALTTSELDFANNTFQKALLNNTAEVLESFEKSLTEGEAALSKTNEQELLKNWTLRTGDQIHSVRSKADVIRMAFCQTVHHRAQLGVFLRLLEVPIPGSYGPSADETPFN